MKLALCNEVLREFDFVEQCRLAAAMGYDGLELAPFTLAQDPFTLSEKQARAFAQQAADHGLEISSLHWLMVKPDGLSLVGSDEHLRHRSLDLLLRLIDFAAAAGAKVLVHGSPAQRSPQGWKQGDARGTSEIDAAASHLQNALSRCAEHAKRANLTYCLEPLAPFETPVINTVAEAAALVDAIGSPALRTMLDVSSASHSEREPVEQVLSKFLVSGHIAHVQVNDKNRRGPGQGDTNQAEVVRALREQGYSGWVAVEPFDYQPDGKACAAFCAGFMRALMPRAHDLPSSTTGRA